ncbi:hypothetical protein DPPLL_36020 [Desulfofustis limnaeus]|uniref:Uncharacterized protein n=1 Tax=Desulfofustis limnaeus TaxID=2740163 RepID=A0ABM7WE50_9BACT|nr:hypothetical protein DPPLL_36020 [Desulfofustis limnaeus]
MVIYAVMRIKSFSIIDMNIFVIIITTGIIQARKREASTKQRKKKMEGRHVYQMERYRPDVRGHGFAQGAAGQYV